jgi:enamine deaminase RidA (YjgF/YER057c/UK114 family)
MALTEKLRVLNIMLPNVSGPFGAYVPAKRAGNLIFVAGQLPRKDGQMLASGPVPSKCSIEQARQGARQCVINALSAVATLGPEALDHLIGVVRVGAFVNSDTAFTEQPKIADAASEFLLELFGPAGQHARAAVAANTLPLGAAVEIEFIFETRHP